MKINIEISEQEAEEIVSIAEHKIKMATINVALTGRLYEPEDKYLMRLADAVRKVQK